MNFATENPALMELMNVTKHHLEKTAVTLAAK